MLTIKIIMTISLIINAIFIVWCSLESNKYNGILQIDKGDPEKDVYQLIITDPFESIEQASSIRLKVDKR